MTVTNFIKKNINSIYILSMIFISLILVILINFNMSNVSLINKYLILHTITTLIISFIYQYVLRKDIIDFYDRVCDVIDKIIKSEEDIDFKIYEETITSKIENKLKQLIDIIKNDREVYKEEKNDIKMLISDISHQIKTPLSNISMYNETLINRELNKSQQITCLSNMKFQVDKLDWLVKCLIKMSRLESNIINLNKSSYKIEDVISRALGLVYLKAESKTIDIELDIKQGININCDIKWTSEAIFNILENAIKYSHENSKVYINIEKLEMFTKIEIKDYGIGIDDNDINNIFKRFYRSGDVSQEEGVGIGLYLARQIIQMQGGYIKVKSKKGVGSSFYIYLLN